MIGIAPMSTGGRRFDERREAEREDRYEPHGENRAEGDTYAAEPRDCTANSTTRMATVIGTV